MQKDDSLYLRGMKPYILSYKAKEKIDRMWNQDGNNVKYERKISKSMNVLYDNHQNHNHSHNNGNNNSQFYACQQLNQFWKLSF